MSDARTRCEAAGLRWTAQRERALELLFNTGRPVKAYDPLGEFKVGAATAPPTVYRALDALVELGIAHRISSINAYVACHGENDGHVASFLICGCCGAVEEVSTPTEIVLASFASQSAFMSSVLTIEAHGRAHAARAEIRKPDGHQTGIRPARPSSTTKRLRVETVASWSRRSDIARNAVSI
ncbi:Fur family transcriptional regulator [Phenylobacterium sp.]|uniref:Fur family transcriptional regulator n=1 Tax=Phenylobacterium sp. TaxID=1871053 RepID=UPI0037C89499